MAAMQAVGSEDVTLGLRRKDLQAGGSEEDTSVFAEKIVVLVEPMPIVAVAFVPQP